MKTATGICIALAVLFLLFFSYILLTNMSSKALNLKEADLHYSVLATGIGPLGIMEASVTNVRDMQLLSLPSFSIPFAFPEWFNVQGHIEVTCDGKKVFSFTDNFRMMEMGGVDRYVVIRNLPSGSCSATIDLVCGPIGKIYCSEQVEQTLYFNV